MPTASNPFPYFPEAGNNGFIYIGAANQDAQTNPVTAYRDVGLTVPWAQPIRTVDGYPAYQGATEGIFTASQAYSITVKDRNGNTFINETLATDPVSVFAASLAAPTGSSLIGFTQSGTGAVTRTAQAKLRDCIDRRDFTTLQQAVDYAALTTRALYLGDEDFTVSSTVVLPNADISIIGPGSGALTITFTGTGGLFVGTAISDATNINIGGFRAMAGAANCGAAVSIAYADSDMAIPAVTLRDIVAEFNESATNYWSGGFSVNNARNSVFEGCYVHGPTADLSRTSYGFRVDGVSTDVKLTNCQAVSVGTALQVLGECEGTILSNFVAVDVNVGISKVHTGGEPWIAMSGWHINCRQKGLVLQNVLQTTITNGLLYCQNGTGDWVGIHITSVAALSQDVMIDALIDGQLAGGGVSSTTGLKIDGGNGISARVKLRSLGKGVDIATGVTHAVLQVEANDVTNIVSGAGAYEETNRLTVNLSGAKFGLPKTSGPYNPDSSASATKVTECFGFGEDTLGNVKETGGIRTVSTDSNWVNSQTYVMARRGDALVAGVVLFGTGTPEGVVTAPVGALYTRSDGGATTTLYVKTSGTGNTGWTAK